MCDFTDYEVSWALTSDRARMGANLMETNDQLIHTIITLVLVLASLLASHLKHAKQLRQVEDAVRDALDKQAPSE